MNIEPTEKDNQNLPCSPLTDRHISSKQKDSLHLEPFHTYSNRVTHICFVRYGNLHASCTEWPKLSQRGRIYK